MESFAVDTTYRLEDLRAIDAAARRRGARIGTLTRRIVVRWASAGFAILFLVGLAFQPDVDSQLAWSFGGLLSLVYLVTVGLLLRRGLQPLPNGILLGKVRFEFDAAGIRTSRRFSEATVRWAQVLGIEVTATHLILWLDAASGYMIPVRDLPVPLTAETAAERLRALIAAAPRDADADARGGITGVPMEYAPPATAVPAATHAVSVPPPRELREIARAMLLRPFDAAHVVGRDATILLLGALLLALWIPIDPLVDSQRLEFDWYSVPGLAWVVGGVFALAWLLSRTSRPRADYRRVLLLTLGALPVAMLGSLAFERVAERWVVPLAGLFGVYALLYFERGLRTLCGRPQYRAAAAGLVAAYLFVWAGHALYVNPSLWVYPEESADGAAGEDDAVWQRVSALQFGQQARIDAEVAKIATHASARPEVFFLGFAGNGRQRVFAEEIALAAKVVGARYHAEDRELQLVNDARDFERRPLATPEALRHALIALGKVMDGDDVLFLALSSHGGEDGAIEVSNAGMVPLELGTEELADMLREAKIPRKVVVISACYAGAFVPVLADDETTVITAAAADRTSFGCADDRDLTYFGEAFWRDALPGAATLSDAFETARRAIGERERQEHVEPSQPQARLAPDVESRLQTLQ